MAIDTVRKRLSMMNMADGTTIYATLWVPSGAGIGLDDRQHLLDCYGGIAFAGAPAANIMGQLRASFRRVESRVFGRVN